MRAAAACALGDDVTLWCHSASQQLNLLDPGRQRLIAAAQDHLPAGQARGPSHAGQVLPKQSGQHAEHPPPAGAVSRGLVPALTSSRDRDGGGDRTVTGIQGGDGDREQVRGTEGEVSGTEGQFRGTEWRVNDTEGQARGTEGQIEAIEGRGSGVPEQQLESSGAGAALDVDDTAAVEEEEEQSGQERQARHDVATNQNGAAQNVHVRGSQLDDDGGSSVIGTAGGTWVHGGREIAGSNDEQQVRAHAGPWASSCAHQAALPSEQLEIPGAQPHYHSAGQAHRRRQSGQPTQAGCETDNAVQRRLSARRLQHRLQVKFVDLSVDHRNSSEHQFALLACSYIRS